MTVAPSTNQALSFAQLEQLWLQAGGSQASAPVAAAIALAESGGHPSSLNNTPSTGDYSVGLWQINYFGNLYPGRTAAFGPPDALTDPLANARAAVTVSNGGNNFDPWSTFLSGAYKQYLPATATLVSKSDPFGLPGVGSTALLPTLIGGSSSPVAKQAGAVGSAVGSAVSGATSGVLSGVMPIGVGLIFVLAALALLGFGLTRLTAESDESRSAQILPFAAAAAA